MKAINYDTEMQNELEGKRARVLIHACCGPCSTSVIQRVMELCEPVMFWYNPNIQPQAEHDERKASFERVCEHFEVEYLQKEWDDSVFEQAARGLQSEREGGRRCNECFYLRLYETALAAKANDFDFFCTTLTVSPHKNARLINEIGESIASAVGVRWLHSDFKKRNGFLQSIRLSEELGLYRQDYCGCNYGRQRED